MTTPTTPEQAREIADEMYWCDEHEWPLKASRCIKSLAAQIEALTAERDAALKLAADRLLDAERYLWLREQHWKSKTLVVTTTDQLIKFARVLPGNGAGFDEAIDSARAAS